MADDEIPFNPAPNHMEFHDLTSPARDTVRWSTIRHHAHNSPRTVVLCEGGYRWANPEAVGLATALRAQLLYCVASTALGQISTVGLDASRVFAETGDRWTELIADFCVEDQESLAYLLDACFTELCMLPSDGQAKLAKAYLPKALRRAWTSGMGLISSYAGETPNWRAIRESLPDSFR